MSTTPPRFAELDEFLRHRAALVVVPLLSTVAIMMPYIHDHVWPAALESIPVAIGWVVFVLSWRRLWRVPHDRRTRLIFDAGVQRVGVMLAIGFAVINPVLSALIGHEDIAFELWSLPWNLVSGLWGGYWIGLFIARLAGE